MSELNEQVKTNIDGVFTRQQRYALELRKSDYKKRLAVLDRFEKVFRDSEEKSISQLQTISLSRRLRSTWQRLWRYWPN